jgi:two-component system OmpR family response regulator
MQQHILVVDDHEDIRSLLGSYLEQHGYRASVASGGKEMRAILAANTVDLVVLDVMMPDEDGITLLKSLRENSAIPVIMLTAMSEDADAVLGLEMGADDYVSKPFSPRVLLARVKAVLRREHEAPQNGDTTKKSNSNQLCFANWRLDLKQRQLIAEDGVIVALSTSEFNLLQVFLNHSEQILSRDQILNFTKGRDAHPFDRSIDNLISRLRKKIEVDPSEPTLIKTVWGGGYLFTEAVT